MLEKAELKPKFYFFELKKNLMPKLDLNQGIFLSALSSSPLKYNKQSVIIHECRGNCAVILSLIIDSCNLDDNNPMFL